MEPTANLKIFLSVRTSLRVYKVTRREIFVRPERATEMTLARVLKRAVSVLSSAYLHESRTYANFRQIVCSVPSADSNEPITTRQRLYPLRLAMIFPPPLRLSLLSEDRNI